MTRSVSHVSMSSKRQMDGDQPVDKHTVRAVILGVTLLTAVETSTTTYEQLEIVKMLMLMLRLTYHRLHHRLQLDNRERSDP